MSRALVIAYGNPLRGDDGVAWRVADLLERTPIGAEVVRCQQLTPELAERLGAAPTVIFVDASRDVAAGAVSERAIEPAGEMSTRLSHVCTPASLVALARLLYGTSPAAFEIGIGIADDGPGEDLSPAVAAALPAVAERIRALIAAS